MPVIIDVVMSAVPANWTSVNVTRFTVLNVATVRQLRKQWRNQKWGLRQEMATVHFRVPQHYSFVHLFRSWVFFKSNTILWKLSKDYSKFSTNTGVCSSKAALPVKPRLTNLILYGISGDMGRRPWKVKASKQKKTNILRWYIFIYSRINYVIQLSIVRKVSTEVKYKRKVILYFKVSAKCQANCACAHATAQLAYNLHFLICCDKLTSFASLSRLHLRFDSVMMSKGNINSKIRESNTS